MLHFHSPKSSPGHPATTHCGGPGESGGRWVVYLAEGQRLWGKIHRKTEWFVLIIFDDGLDITIVIMFDDKLPLLIMFDDP